jgi:hypothetical protein
MNTERFTINGDNIKEPGIYTNKVHNFVGTLREARDYAQSHGFGGGVEVASRITGKLTFTRV